MRSSFCTSVYDAIIMDDHGAMNIWHIMICALSLVFTLLAYAIFRRNQTASTKNHHINRNTVLPLYEKLLLCYMFSIAFTLLVWILEFHFGSCFTLQSTYWWLSILCSFQTAIKRFFELFIILFISRESAGHLAIKQSMIRSFSFGIFLWITYFFMFTTQYIDYPFSAPLFYIISELIYCVLLIFIMCYCCCNHWLRMRNLYFLLIYILVIQSLYIIAGTMNYLHRDGHCLNDIGDLLQIILFPVLIIYIIRADSYFWRTIFQTISESTRINKVFGRNKISQQFSTRLSDDRGVFAYTPMTDFLSMKCPIIDFGNIKIGSNPVGYGSTSMVYPALLNGSQLVAAKTFTVEEITIKCVADFVRETLLSAEIDHPNIVKFIGCCIRPPEICLVYEICSHGDLASFIFTQNRILNDQSMHNSACGGNIWNTPISETFDKYKYNQYDAEQSEHHLSDLQSPSGDRPHAVDDGLFGDLSGMPEFDIMQTQRTLLSDNTTIPTLPSPNDQRWLMSSPDAKNITIQSPMKDHYASPFQDSSPNSNKYGLGRPALDIVDSFKAKMSGVHLDVHAPLLSLHSRLVLLQDIAKGMAFLHKRNMLHRDLKTGNVLVNYEIEQNRFLAKVCDFGSSRYVSNTSRSRRESQGKGQLLEPRRELSLTNYKNAKKSNKTKRKKKKISPILANAKALRLNINNHKPRTSRQMSYTDDEKSFSVTATSTRYLDSITADIPCDNKENAMKKGLLPEPIRNLSTVAYTAPENLGHIDFSPFEQLYKSSPVAHRGKAIKIINEQNMNTKKKYDTMTIDGANITPLFEGGMSLDSEPIEMIDDGMILTQDISDGMGLMNGNNVDLKTAFKSDVFSFGVIIWEVICMQPIYDGMNVIEIRDMVLNGDRLGLTEFDELMYLSHIKAKRENERKRYHKVQQLMNVCWKQDASSRPHFEEIVQILTDIISD
eukprot:300423_1